MIPQLTWDTFRFDVNNVVSAERNRSHNPQLESGKAYVLRWKGGAMYWNSNPIAERENPLTQKIEEARRWSAEYLNRTAWDWSLENEAIVCPT